MNQTVTVSINILVTELHAPAKSWLIPQFLLPLWPASALCSCPVTVTSLIDCHASKEIAGPSACRCYRLRRLRKTVSVQWWPHSASKTNPISILHPLVIAVLRPVQVTTGLRLYDATATSCLLSVTIDNK